MQIVFIRYLKNQNNKTIIMAKLLSTTINGFLSSVNFVSGALGTGWRIFNRLGKWVFETDDIVVRGTMTVFELLISKIRAIKGALGITQASGKVKSIREDEENYYLETEDEMSFMADDIIRCLEFNGSKRNYWVVVSAVNGNEIKIPKSEFEGSNTPQVGDELIQFGNTTNKKRQSAIYLHASESGEPAIDVLFGINGKTFAGCTKIRIGGDIPGTNGLKGFYCENGMLKGLNEAGELMYCLYPDGAAYLGAGAAIFRPDKSGNIAGGAISWQWDSTKQKYVCTMGDVILTWDNLSNEVREKLKGEPGQDANLLSWVKNWTVNAVEIGSEYLISPKIFSGTNTGTADQPALTGVALGREVVTVDGNMKTGLFGLKNGKLTFSIDAETGEAAFLGTLNIGDGANVINPDKTGCLANGNITWDADGNATFKGIVHASGGSFTGKIQSSASEKIRFVLDPGKATSISPPVFKMLDNTNTLIRMSYDEWIPNVFLPSIRVKNHFSDTTVSRCTANISPFSFSILETVDDSVIDADVARVMAKIGPGKLVVKNLPTEMDSALPIGHVIIDTSTDYNGYCLLRIKTR